MTVRNEESASSDVTNCRMSRTVGCAAASRDSDWDAARAAARAAQNERLDAMLREIRDRKSP